ncbi:hypothetical protein DV735_g3788, partial [Chaetothyriales sp. CBS 134920]
MEKGAADEGPVAEEEELFPPPDLPVPIWYVGGRYLVFDIKTAAWLRREHNVCGYNVGTLPQAPSQNVFLGLPIMIMPEEAQLLVEKGVACVVDDARAHDQAIYASRCAAREHAYLDETRQHASALVQQRLQEQAEARERALGKQRAKKAKARQSQNDYQAVAPDFIDPVPTPTPTPLTPPQPAQSYHVTPTSSHPLLASSTPLLPKSEPLPGLPASYPLFRHLHSRGFFMTPGLRFGCQYSTYPGDPLRYHSHFLSVGVGWDEELDLMDIVGGGRLGTGVKKGFLIGGIEPQEDAEAGARAASVRTFTVEWAVM